MGDWATTEVVPGGKAYLFYGDSGNAVDYLIHQASATAVHRITLRPPIAEDELSTHMGNDGELFVTVIRSAELLSDLEWDMLGRYLTPSKVKGRSLIIAGGEIVFSPTAQRVRSLIQRQGKVVAVVSPSGMAARKSLEEWVSRTWNTSSQVAHQACLRSDYSIGELLWSSKVWLSVTRGSRVEGQTALALLGRLLPSSDLDSAYNALLSRVPVASLSLSPEDTLSLCGRLETALTDLTSIRPVLGTGVSLKSVGAKTGLSEFRVTELAPLVSRYPPSLVAKCRQALAIGFANYRQPETSSLVALLWR